MNTLETTLTGFAQAEFDRLEVKYPAQKPQLELLRASVLTGLSTHAADPEALGDFIDSIQNLGGDLDVDGYVYSELWDFEHGLRKLVREALSKNTPTFPHVSVKLALAAGVTSKPDKQSAANGKRTKLGGVPDWIQGDATPICKQCVQTMVFVAQIDSIGCAKTPVGRSLAKADAFAFGDCGMIYVFWCNRCYETTSVFQFH